MFRSRDLRLSRLLLFSGLLLGLTGCVATPSAGPLVVLITDFGAGGSYVGSLKGSIYRDCPGVRIDEITHEIPNFDVAEGARILSEAAPAYPPGTIFVGVVDPGVGTARRPIAARTADGNFFIGPDNGLLSLAIEAAGLEEARAIDYRTKDPIGSRLSTTFHGRDIFGPAAAALARGEAFETMGPLVSSIVRVPSPPPLEVASGVLKGSVIEVDGYGNVITNIPCATLREAGGGPGEVLLIWLDGDFGSMAGSNPGPIPRTIPRSIPWVKAYADVPVGDLLCLENSQGRLELAINQGHLGKEVGVKVGDGVRVTLP